MKSYKIETFHSNTHLDYESSLNQQQLEVVRNGNGPCLVLAGAGSGKTRVLIYRLAYLLEQRVDPRNILLVTFTNKAAQEMTHRSESLMKTTLNNLWSGTFHHIGNTILRKECRLLGFSPNFTIIDQSDAKDLIDDCIEDLGFSKQGKLFPKKGIILNIWSLSTNSLTSIDSAIANHYAHIGEFASQIKKVISLYTEKKKKANLMDFSDLLFYWHKILQNNVVLEKYSTAFKYILVDEYQDTNRIQFEILQKLSSHHNNLLVVGDDAQSIYSFRSADINNLLNFPKIFAGAKVFKLETNYRSTPPILDLANEIIRKNINQFPKELKAVRERGYLPAVVATKDVYQQAQFVAQRTLELNRENTNLGEIAVLFRSRFQAIELELELLKRNIPYVLRGGVRFFEQAHIKDVFSFLKIIVNPKDELSFKRAVCLQEGIGRGYAHKIWSKVVEKKSNDEIITSLPKRQKQGFLSFQKIMNSISSKASAEEAVKTVVNSYKNYCYLSFDNPDDRIQDLEELAKMARNFSSIKDFLLDLGSYEDFKGETLLSSRNKEELLVLSTIHQAKGLEWDTVFLIGFGDYEFPHPKALNSPDALEEERRLFYVAATRAKTNLYLSYPQNKYTFKNGLVISRASMFLYELDPSSYEEWNIEDPHLL